MIHYALFETLSALSGIIMILLGSIQLKKYLFSLL